MTFHGIHIGETFLIMYDYSGLHVKISKQTALNLLTGQLCPVHQNKKVEPPGSLSVDKRLFLAWQHGNPVLCRKVNGGFEFFRLLIVKNEICRLPLEIQGIPYGSSDEVDIILAKLQATLEKCQSLAQTLAALREA